MGPSGGKDRDGGREDGVDNRGEERTWSYTENSRGPSLEERVRGQGSTVKQERGASPKGGPGWDGEFSVRRYLTEFESHELISSLLLSYQE